MKMLNSFELKNPRQKHPWKIPKENSASSYSFQRRGKRLKKNRGDLLHRKKESTRKHEKERLKELEKRVLEGLI